MDRPQLLRVLLLLGAVGIAGRAGEDPYLRYLETAEEFRPVADVTPVRWDRWLYMPWRYQWAVGTGDEGGRFCREFGIHGGFSDWGTGPFDWLERWELRFYNDHTAGKGWLHLKSPEPSGEVRPVPVDGALFDRLRAEMAKQIRRVSSSPMRVAYSLDDEISWCSFVRPIPWRIHGDEAAYRAWRKGYYGEDAPDPLPLTMELAREGPLRSLDFSPLLDRLTYNDSVWAILIGRLVAESNRLDPETPCGFVGAQAPSLWGGYDYAKIMRKVQFLEPYDLGSAPAIARSLRPGVPIVQTHFRGDDSWKAWNGFAHGERGMIGWVEGWFEGREPAAWLRAFRPALREIGEVHAKRVIGARWLHDGIAILYSHPSIQVSWCLDAEAHGKTWPNRNRDHLLGTSHLVRKAWEFLLQDAGLQYDFLAYDVLAREGVPAAYRVLILPACYALSEAEARRVREFVGRGGVAVADFACGLFDPHGRGRTAGVLDDLFGVVHDGTETRKDLFGGELWVETHQDRGYQARNWAEFFGTIPCRLRQGYAVAERRLPEGSARSAGRGRAVYLNLSPQRYLQYRAEGSAEAGTRAPFLDPLGALPEVTTDGRNLEITRWRAGDRILLFVVQNPPLRPDGTRALSGVRRRIELRFAHPVRDLVDERAFQSLGDGDRFLFDFPPAEALFLSYLPE